MNNRKERRYQQWRTRRRWTEYRQWLRSRRPKYTMTPDQANVLMLCLSLMLMLSY